MECCNPAHPLSSCEPCTPRPGPTLKPHLEVVGKALNYLLSPEASNLEHPRPDPLAPSWM